MTSSSPNTPISFTSALLKSKFRSSIDRLKKLFNLNRRWSRLPTTAGYYSYSSWDGDRRDDEWDNEEYSETESLITNGGSVSGGSRYTLPIITTTRINTPTRQKPISKQEEVKRINKELIDDEIPLIKI